MNESLTLRAATPDDIDLIMDFIYRLAVHEGRPEDMTAERDRMATLLFEDRAAEVTLAFWEGAPAAFALYYPIVSTFSGAKNLYIEDLYVDEAFRRHGIARALFLTLAETPGIDGLKWTCLLDNDDAIGFYERLGAEQHLASWNYYLKRGR